MGCAIAENNQEQKQLHQTNVVVVDRHTTMSGGGCPRSIASMARQPPNTQKVSQLKESHSALVKILESAPLKKATKPPQSHPQPPPSHQRLSSHQPQPIIHHSIHTKQESQLRPESGSESMSPPPTVHNDNAGSRPPNQHYYRKRAKHLTICDTASSSGDEEGSPPTHSEGSTATESMCPWKKTRIAREWRQKRESTDASESSAAEPMICDDEEDDEDVDDGVEVDDEGCCECQKDNKTTPIGWRRASSESSSGCDDSHRSPSSSPPNAASCSAHGSECGDSDGGHNGGNISELCKKFQENLSENDVRYLF